jgi:TolA-binding protein
MAFRKIVEIWPHELGVTDEAYIYLGDSYLAEKKYEAALRAYIPIIDKLSRSKFIDNAYYKIGLCSMELNRLSDGSTFFNEVIHNHRHSPFVRSAKAKLEAIRVLSQGCANGSC